MAIELIDKIKQKNNGTFKLVDSVDVEMQDGSDLQSTIDEIIKNGGSGIVGGYYIGDTPPENVELIWIDTSGESIDNTLDSIIINELRTIISNLNNKILELESRVIYLELNGGTLPDVTSTKLAFEDGGIMIFEDGSIMTFEGQSPPISNAMLFEDNSKMLFEDNNIMIFE